MKLYGSHLSMFAARVAMMLEIKGHLDAVPLENVPGGLHSDEHYALTKTGKIPFLVKDNGDVLIESQVIAEYLDNVLDGPDMCGHSADERAQISLICRLVDMYFMPALGPLLMAIIWQRPNEKAIENSVNKAIPEALDYLEHYLGGDGYAVGDNWTLADCAIIGTLYSFLNLMSDFGVGDFGDRPKLKAWWHTVKDKPETVTCLDRAAKVVQAMMAARAADK